MSSSALALAAVAAKIDTIGQARAALGVVSQTLADAYQRLPGVPATADLRNSARELLDQVNGYAQRVYGIWNADADLQDEEISTLNATKVALAISQANDGLNRVEDLANANWWDIAAAIEEVLRTVGGAVGSAVSTIGKAVAAGGTAFLAAAWPEVLVAGAVVTIYVFRKRIFAAISQAGG